jgi:hypothetical protein
MCRGCRQESKSCERGWLLAGRRRPLVLTHVADMHRLTGQRWTSGTGAAAPVPLVPCPYARQTLVPRHRRTPSADGR